VSRDSVAGIATSYVTDGPWLVSLCGVESANLQTVPEPALLLVQLIPGLFPRGKAAGGCFNHPPPSVEVKERVALYSTPHTVNFVRSVVHSYTRSYSQRLTDGVNSQTALICTYFHVQVISCVIFKGRFNV
jgi:hypothetical protein